MKEIKLTCPFTGIEFSALEYSNGTLIVKHPLTGEMQQISYNWNYHTYTVPYSMFQHIETVTLSQAAKILNVSRQRISQIYRDQVIPAKEINGTPVFVKADVERYAHTRKVGAPFKNNS